MILSTKWIPFKGGNHPELNMVQLGEMLYALKFIDEKSSEAIMQRAIKMRSLEIFQEPYDPPEYMCRK
jgi:hypothetical protein